MRERRRSSTCTGSATNQSRAHSNASGITRLFNFDAGARTRLAYWVNREYYPLPTDATCGSGDTTEVEEGPTGRALSVAAHLAQTSLEDEAAALTSNQNAARRARGNREADRRAGGRATAGRPAGGRSTGLHPAAASGPAAVDYSQADTRVHTRRARLPLRTAAPRPDASEPAGTNAAGRRTLHRHRAQPGLDDRVRRAIGSGSEQISSAALCDHRFPARHRRGAGPGEDPARASPGSPYRDAFSAG